MAACDMTKQCSQCGGEWRRRQRLAEPFRRGETPSNQTNAGTFDITLATGDLAGKAKPRVNREAQLLIEQPRRIEKGIAMEAAEAGEFRTLQSRYGPEDAGLLAVFELGLEAHHVEEGCELIVLPQLDHCVWERLNISCHYLPSLVQQVDATFDATIEVLFRSDASA